MIKNYVARVAFIFLGSAGFALAQVTLPNPLTANSITNLICSIAVYVSSIVGTLAVLMFIWAGILYLTGGAKPDNIQRANKAVLYASIGLAIALIGTGLIALISFIVGGSSTYC